MKIYQKIIQVNIFEEMNGKKNLNDQVFLKCLSLISSSWWAAVSGVAQSWTRLKQLSSSSSSFWGVLTLTVYVKSYHLMEKYLQCTKIKFFQAISQYPESSVQLKKMYSHKNILKIYPPLTFKHFLKLSFTFKHFIR